MMKDGKKKGTWKRPRFGVVAVVAVVAVAKSRLKMGYFN